MPWDASTCFVATTGEHGALANERVVAGGADVSISQPRFRADNTLCFLSDVGGYWALYAEGNTSLAPGGADCASPDWVLGQESYAFNARDELFIVRHEIDGEHLYRVATDRLVPLAPSYLAFGAVVANGDRLLTLAGSPTTPLALIDIDPDTGEVEVIKRSRISERRVAISTPSAITFTGGDGLESHAWFYPPANADFSAPAGELPPLIVLSHGGPTSAAAAVYDVSKQFFTSRGIAVVDVNYGGSSGYGRAYRNRLRYQWGLLDVADCVAAAKYLATRHLVDGNRLVIRGGSAGGYTTLAALATTDVFAAGSSHYGVSDLKSLATDTHKFESRYLDRLIGAWPDDADVYFERSPLEHADQIACPVIFFQGLDDAIVPPSQAERMVTALRYRHIPVAYLAFPGESHGFRIADTIRSVAVAELTFLGKVLGFEPDTSSDLVIDNADALPSQAPGT
jgi:dipeptidyl aminopeptidase/acylaminoacyl peptidase